MNPQPIITELSLNQGVFESLLTGLEPEMYNWKQSPDKWSLLEIVCHLHDEEVEDFRTRTFHVLESPGTPPPPIDPVAWVTDRAYATQDFEAMVQKFLNERSESVKMLEALQEPQWDNSYEHPTLGTLSAKLFFSNWLAHDYLHIRQIMKLKFDYLRQVTGEDLAYAGSW